MQHVKPGCHNSPYRGHHVAERTTKNVLQSGLFWPTLFKDCHEFVKTCDRCLGIKTIIRRNEMSLTNILEVEIFDVWSIDFI